MKAKKMLAYLFAFAMVFTSTVGTSSLQAEAKAKTKVKKVTIKNELYGKKLYVAKGKKATIKANVNVTPNKKAKKKVTFKSKNAKIAKVDKKGKVAAKKVGTTKITVASKVNKKKKATVTVVVTNPVKSISLDKSKLELEEGKTATLKATVAPTKKVCKYVKWSSVDSKVATVDQNGNVKAVSEGKVTIKATAVDGSKKFATCEVEVKKATTQKKEDNKKPQTPEKKLSIEKVEFFDPMEYRCTNIIDVTLNNDKDMDKSCFDVKLVTIKDKNANVKVQSDDEEEEYVRTFAVENVKKVAAGKYRVYLSDYFLLGEIALVSVKGVEKPAQAQYLLPARDVSYVVMRNVTSLPEDYDEDDIYNEGNEYVDYYLDFVNLIDSCQIKMVSGKLPKGLEYIQGECDVYGEFIEAGIVGFPREAGEFTVVFEATDSRGAVAKHTVTFMIGDENSLYAESVVEPYNTYENEPFNMFARIVGGSGDYAVSVDKQYADMVRVGVDDSYVSFDFDNGMKAGNYVIPYTVKDNQNAKLSAKGTIEFAVVKGCKVDIDVNGSQAVLIDEKTGIEYFYDYDAGRLVVPVGTYDVYVYDTFMNLILIDRDLVINGDIKKEYPSIGECKFKLANVPEDCSVRAYLLNKEGRRSMLMTYEGLEGGEILGIGDVTNGEYKIVVLLLDKWGTVVERKEKNITVKDGSVCNLELDTTDVNPENPIPVSDIEIETGEDSYSCEVTTVKDGVVYYTFTPKTSDNYYFYIDGYDAEVILLDGNGNVIDWGYQVSASLDVGNAWYIGVRDEDYVGKNKVTLNVEYDSDYYEDEE